MVTGLAVPTFLSAMVPVRPVSRACTWSPETRPDSDTAPVVRLTLVERSYWRSVALMPLTVSVLGVMSTLTAFRPASV